MYRLYSFGTTVLPDAVSEYQEETTTPDTAVPVIGGGTYDAFGSNALQPLLPARITYVGMIRGSTIAALRTSLQTYLGLVGKKYNLSRSALDNAEEIFCSARLISVERVHKPINYFGKFIVCKFTFNQLSRWQGTTRNQSISLPVGGTSQSVQFANNGNRNQEDVVISLTAGSAAISMFGIDLPVALCSWRWNGSIALAGGSTLVIDCGAKSVTKNGLDDYASFITTGNHKIEPWLSVMPGQTPDGAETVSGSILWSDNVVGGTPAVLTITTRDAWM